jgi:hypothetical protein
LLEQVLRRLVFDGRCPKVQYQSRPQPVCSVRGVILQGGMPCYGRDLPSMTSGARRPRTHAVVCTYEIVASIHSIVTVGKSLDEFSIHERAGSTVSALVVGAQGI